MTSVIRYSPSARNDLGDIAEYLEREASAKIAKAILSRIRRHVKTLERDALRYRERRELGEGRRAHLIGPDIAFYRGDSEAVLILRILHASRDIKSKLLD